MGLWIQSLGPFGGAECPAAKLSGPAAALHN